MANMNCLEGMACPVCGSEGPFEIAIDCVHLVDDEGTQQQLGDSAWDNASYCGCRACSHSATAGDFDTANQLERKLSLAKEVFTKVCLNVESIYIDNTGAYLADLMSSILNHQVFELFGPLDEQEELFVAVLKRSFPEDHQVWNLIDIIEGD